eukprot:m.244497 g.244497  ORF g.244497 m.244497 type:complete len:355 (-) comp19473_c0_seq6:733-1797(-)
MTISVGSRANSRETFMNLVKVGIGPGCLALPYAFTKAGFIMAPLVLVLMTLMVYRNMKIIIEIKELLKNQNPTKQFATYGDISGHLLGHNWGVVVDYLLVSMQLGICTVYFRFIPTNLSATISSVPQSHWLILIAPCLVALTWIRHMKSLAVFSTFANVATMMTIIVILLFAGQNLVHRGAFASGLPAATLATAPVFFGSAIYSFEGCGAIPSIHESMADPKQFNTVLSQAGIVIFFCFFFTGLLCYVSYGHITSGSMTAELAERTSNPIIGLCNVMMAVAVALTYPMQVTWNMRVDLYQTSVLILLGTVYLWKPLGVCVLLMVWATPRNLLRRFHHIAGWCSVCFRGLLKVFR